MQTILMYQDYGVDAISKELLLWLKKHLAHKYKIEKTDATSIIELGALDKNIKAFVLPGGHSRFFREKLKGKGNLLIRDFIKKGGLYYGFCGGAYYACNKVIFEGHDLQVSNDKNNLSLFSGKAIGSIAELTKIKYNGTKDSANAVVIKFDEKTANIYYNGGPYFEGDIENTLGTYEGFKNVPALISGNYGTGKYIFSSVHPEITPKDLEKTIFKNMNSNTKEIIEKIIKKMNQEHIDLYSKFLLQDLLK